MSHPDTLTVGEREYSFYPLASVAAPDLARLPYTVKVLLENMLRGAATHPEPSPIRLDLPGFGVPAGRQSLIRLW